MADTTGISFIRTLRGNTPVRTPADEPVRIGGSRIVRGADADDVAIVACGVTVDEADNAADAPGQEGIRARVIDCYSIKPIDVETLQTAARDAARSSRSGTSGPRAGSGTRCWRRSPTPTAGRP